MTESDDDLPADLFAAAFTFDADPLGADAEGTVFEVGELIDRGGMGSVHRGRQLAPVVRDVAIKVLGDRPGRHMVADRIRKEALALARLDHPSIPKVHGLGVLKDGRPFLAMDLIDGTPLLPWCDSQKLSIDDRVRIAIPIVEALAHAHARGILHRDVKPGNVLVSSLNGHPVPRLIDFGIAKGLHEELGQRLTAEGVVIGTLESMAPEQVLGHSDALAPTTDIYGMGALLSELLCGLPPFDASRLRSVAPAEFQRIVTEEVPPLLPERLGQAGAARDSIAASRGTTVTELTRTLAGDLAAIVGKCLEKNPARRYADAQGLAQDLRRYLDRLPVSARRPGPIEEAWRFGRRHRKAMALFGATFLVLTAGIVVAVLWAQSEEDAAGREKTLRHAAEAARDEAHLAASDSQGALQFMVSLLAQADHPNPSPVAVELVRDADRQLEKWVTLSPRTEACIREAVGHIHYLYNDYRRAGIQFERARRLHRAAGTLTAAKDRHLRLLIAVAKAARGDTDAALSDGYVLLDEAKHAVPPNEESVARAELTLAHICELTQRYDEVAKHLKAVSVPELADDGFRKLHARLFDLVKTRAATSK